MFAAASFSLNRKGYFLACSIRCARFHIGLCRYHANVYLPILILLIKRRYLVEILDLVTFIEATEIEGMVLGVQDVDTQYVGSRLHQTT